MKRLLSGILAFLMVVSMMPVQAFATENEPDTAVEAVAVEATEQTTVPTEADTEPEKETTVPTEAEAEPEKETTVPTEAETEPVEETTVPTEAETEPVEETIVPTEAEEEPAEETTVPTEETEPVEKTASTEEMIIPVESVTIFQKENLSELIAEDTMQLTATVLPENATEKTVVWSSSDETVATVDNNGVVTAVAEGSVSIIAECAGQTSAYSVIVLAKDPANRDISSELSQKEELPKASYKAAYPLPALSGNQAMDVAAVAKSQVGYTYSNGTIYGEWWTNITNWGVDYTRSAWCGMFACWCANKAGAGLGAAYDKNGASSGLLFDFLKRNGTYDTSGSTNPKPGDFLFFWGYNEKGQKCTQHVAIVTDYNTSSKTITFYGGNQGGGAVTKSSVKWSINQKWGSQYVEGYGRPKYKNTTVKYTVNFAPNGGSCSETSRTVEKGKTIGSLPTPTRDGFTFNGWYTQPYGGSKVTSSTVPSADMTLYAHYTYNSSAKAKISFNFNGGSVPGAELSDTIDGVNIGRPGESLVVFNGAEKYWTNIYGSEVAVNANGKVVDYRAYESATLLSIPSGGFVLSGQVGWDSSARENVGGGLFIWDIHDLMETGSDVYISLNYETGAVKVFDSYDGYLAEAKKIVDKNKSIGTLPTPTRSSYSFKGWYTAASGGTKVTSSTVVNGNMTLYAQWDNNVNSVDLGQDFYAFIKFKSGGNGLSNVNGNVELGVYEQTESLWRFVLNDDDTYTIENAVDGKMMDVYDNSSEDGTNIWTYPANGTEAQKWYIKWTGSGYSLISAGSYKALDIGYGRTDIGANVQLWEANGSEAQLFDINIVYSPAITPFDSYHEMTIGETDSIETRFNVSWSRDYVQDLDYGVSVSCDEALDCGWTYQDGDNWTMVINARKAGTYTVTALLYNSDWSEVIDECDITVKVTDPNAGAICTNHNFVNHVCKKCGAKSAKITGQTSKISTPENCEVTFNVDATGDGLYYNWYYAEPGWETFYYVEGVSGNSYTFTVSKDMDGYRFLCAVHDAYGNYEFTGVMTLEIVTSVKITQQPKSVTVAEGATAKVTVKATGDGLTYRWYYKDAGKTSYTYTSSFKSNTYSVTMNEARNGRRVLCKVYDKYGNMVQSASALLSMQKANPVKITAQPVSVTVAEGATAKVTVKATGDDLTYRWYYKDAGKSSYIYTSSFKSNTYSVTMNEARNGRRVLCKVYDKYGNMVQSNSALLSMKQTVKITQQPKSVIVAEGATAKVTVKATGDGLTYRWYYKDAGKSSYTYTSSFKSNTYSVTMNAARNGRRVLCKVYDKYGNMVQSSSALLSMK